LENLPNSRKICLNISVQYLRDLFLFFGIKFKIKESELERFEIVGVGIGFVNVNKAVT
jgi:hypothetical protein